MGSEAVAVLGVKPPKELFLLVNAKTGEVGDAVLFELIEKYREDGFEPVRYVLQPLSRPLTRERTVDGVRERQCNRCKGWWPLTEMVKAKRCAGGRRNECRHCANDKHRIKRARAKDKASGGMP